jgi:hypothetical protein
MANRFRGEVGITVDDEDYILVMDLNVIAEIEDQFGDKAEKVLESIEKSSAPIKMMRTLAHLMLQPRHPGASIQLAGVILSEDQTIVSRAIAAASPAAAAVIEAGQGAGNAPAGKRRKKV